MNRTLEEDIRTALREGAANEETRADWTRIALSQSEPPRRRPIRPIRPLWPVMAAAVLLTIGFWPRSEESDAPDAGTRSNPDETIARETSVDDQRKANVAYLEKEDSKTLKKDGIWAVVTGGDTFHVADKPQDALATADRLAPKAKHRFVFRVGGDAYTRGDVIADRSPVAPKSLGAWFFQRTGIDPKKHKSLRLRINGRPITFRTVPKSMASILLPKSELLPRFEIPGRMILEDQNRNWRSFRRYFVHVQCDKPKLDLWTEAIGATEGEDHAPGDWVAVRLGNHVFHALRSSPAEAAAKESKAVLVLRFAKGATRFLHPLFEHTDLRDVAQYAVPNAKRTVLERYNKDGTLVRTLLLPDNSAKTRQALRAFLETR